MNEKLFLCFGFRHFTPANLREFHVTHLWLGAIGENDLAIVLTTIDNFFSEGLDIWPMNREIVFSERAFFGPNKDIPVLLPVAFNMPAQLFLSKVFLKKLREEIETNIQSKPGFGFNPHLTTNLDWFRGTIDKLYLCGKGYRVIKEWEL